MKSLIVRFSNGDFELRAEDMDGTIALVLIRGLVLVAMLGIIAWAIVRTYGG